MQNYMKICLFHHVYFTKTTQKFRSLRKVVDCLLNIIVFLMSCDRLYSVTLLRDAWVGQKYVIVVFSGHTRLLFNM